MNAILVAYLDKLAFALAARLADLNPGKVRIAAEKNFGDLVRSYLSAIGGQTPSTNGEAESHGPCAIALLLATVLACLASDKQRQDAENEFLKLVCFHLTEIEREMVDHVTT